LEECTSELEVLRKISIESSLEIEKLSLENEKLKAEIVELKKSKKIVTYEK
jgi:hypothetical protein